METLVCPSKYFANKQNLRSFVNILKNTKKSKNEDLIKNIFKETESSEVIVCDDVPFEIKIILINLIKNVKENSRKDFLDCFIRQPCKQSLLPVDKEIVLTVCYKVLFKIIPKEFYKSNHNLKLVRKFIKITVYTMKSEQISINKIVNNWILLEPWTSINQPMKIICQVLHWILKKVIAGIICLNFYVTTCKLTNDDNRLFYFWLPEWQSFYDKSVNKMKTANIIEKSYPHCLSKKNKNTISNRIVVKKFNVSLPKLHLILKNKYEYRPIVQYRNQSMNILEKRKIKDRLDMLKTLGPQNRIKLETEYKNIHDQWISLGKPKLYFVKTDLTNAFGSIDKTELMKILAEEHINYQKLEKNLSTKRRIAQIYKDFITEFKAPLLIRAGSTVFEWKKGLVQGYKYSPALSEIYYSRMDQINFAELNNIQTRITLLTRVVDDYLFITDSLEKAHAFLNCLSNYRNVNYDKTEVNFHYPGIICNNQIIFLGYCYNTENLEVSRAHNVYAGQMCYKISFYNTQNIHKFLESRIGQSGVQISGHIFNFYYNTEELIWNQIFITFCISANKFCTILAMLFEGKEMVNYLQLFKKKVTVKLSNAIIFTLKRNKPTDYVFRYCINHFRFLSWKALLLIAKKTPKCSGLIPGINDEMAKSNCIFGKWREHASRIDSDGNIGAKAVRDICTRLDLRVIMKNFEKVPSPIKFYSNRNKL